MRNKARDRKAIELRDQGLSLSEIGERLGLTRQAVSVVLDRQGYGGSSRRQRKRPPPADADRVRLLFGPYAAPALKRRDRVACLFRDCTVIITGWSSGPIPWPRCRAFGSTGGGSGLLVDEELARAVRHESAAAVMHWWGVSQTAVFNWRKALGVTRTGNEGTARLILAAAQRGAEGIKARPWTNEERERRGQAAVENDLARNLIPGYHGPSWTPEETVLLGTGPDEEVARRVGRTLNAVRLMRERLGIARPDGGRWRVEELALLGTFPDREVARRLGRSLSSVTQKRCKLGIASPSNGR